MITTGTRVRTLIHLDTDRSICGCTNCHDIPVGALGTVTDVHSYGGYGVLFDDDTHRLPCSMDIDNLEVTE